MGGRPTRVLGLAALLFRRDVGLQSLLSPVFSPLTFPDRFPSLEQSPDAEAEGH